MGYIDLHVHSNASDGTLTPSEVVAYAISKQLDAIALTDHDTIDGIEEALLAAESTSLEVIPGIELSCVYLGTEIHILGLFPDIHDSYLTGQLENLRRIRSERNEEMIRCFNRDGICLSIEELTHGNPHTVITRAHFARVLTAKNYAKSMDQAFKKFLQYGGSYCHRKELISPEYAMNLLVHSHAYPIIAHPMLYRMGYHEIETLISYLKELGLRGIEVYHSSHNQYQSGKLKDLAKKYRLLSSGGSDFHGSNKPDIDIGKGRGSLRLSHLFLDEIKASYLNERSSAL